VVFTACHRRRLEVSNCRLSINDNRMVRIMGRCFTVAKAEKFTSGKCKKIFAGDRRIAVFNDGGTLHAIDDSCTHVGGSLSEGSCENGIVTCPWHGAQFRLSDGQGLGPPAYRRVTVYPIQITNGVIEVEVVDE